MSFVFEFFNNPGSFDVSAEELDHAGTKETFSRDWHQYKSDFTSGCPQRDSPCTTLHPLSSLTCRRSSFCNRTT